MRKPFFRRQPIRVATVDVRPYLEKADEPYEAPKRKFWSEVGSYKGTTALAEGLHDSIICAMMGGI